MPKKPIFLIIDNFIKDYKKVYFKPTPSTIFKGDIMSIKGRTKTVFCLIINVI